MTPTHRITTTVAVVLSLAAAGAPTAAARDRGRSPVANQAAAVYSRQDKSLIPITTPHRDSPSDGITRQAVVRIQAPPTGFDWGDAGIGAAGGVALALLGLGGALAISQRRPRRSHQTTSLS
jgi:hypothetical protein